MSIFKGSATAIVTPFNEDKSINFNSYEKLLKFQLENEIDAIVVAGTTGESSTITEEEYVKLLDATIQIINKKVPVIAGIGSNNTKQAIKLMQIAKNLKSDAVLSLTPYYNKTTQKGILEHFKAIAKSNKDMPIILYNVPSRTGLNIEIETLKQLCEINNIVAIKEASGDISQVAQISLQCKKLDIYSGNDDQITATMSLGGAGVISVLSNIAPKQTNNIVKAYLNGDVKTSLQLQLNALNLIKCLFNEPNPIPIKTALNIMNFEVGGFRLPLTEIDIKNEIKLKQAMHEYGLI